MRRRLFKARLFYRSVRNWLTGLAFTSVSRCRFCDHTVYPTDRRGAGCRYCS